MGIIHYTNETKEEQLKYLNNRYGEIINQFDYNFPISQLLKFSKFSNRKVFKIINIILLCLTIFIGLMWLKIGYKADTFVRIIMVLFIRFFGLFLKIAIFILNKESFKTEIRKSGILIYHGPGAISTYSIKEISNIEMDKYYDGSIPSIKFIISDIDGIKHYYYRPSDDIIEKFCNESILYYKKKNINIKIPIDNREPTVYEAKYHILDYWKLLSDKEKENVNNYIQRGLFTGFGLALFLTVMASASSDGSSSDGGGSFLMFCFIFIAISFYHVMTLGKGLSTFKTEIKENQIIIRKMNLSHDYINCSLITDAKYKHFEKDGLEGIKLTINFAGKENNYTWLRNSVIENFCSDVVEIAKYNKEYYARINSSG